MGILRKKIVFTMSIIIIILTANGLGEKRNERMIEISLRPPMPFSINRYMGHVHVPNFETTRYGEKHSLLVPVGVRNIALGKKVSSSDLKPIRGKLSMITDGEKEAYEEGSVELGPFGQYIKIDLEEECEIFAITVWRYYKSWRVYFDVVVQIADDRDFTRNVRTVFNNDIDNTAGFGKGTDKHYQESYQGRLIDAKGQRACFVRLYSNGNNANDLNHYSEVEVWGRPIGEQKCATVSEDRVLELLEVLLLQSPSIPLQKRKIPSNASVEQCREYSAKRRAPGSRFTARKDRAVCELAGMGDGFVDILVEELTSRGDRKAGALGYAVVPVLTQMVSDKAKMVLLDMALGKYSKDGPQVYAANQYIDALEDKSQAVKLLESDNESVIRSALQHLKVIDDELMVTLRQILQSEDYRSRIHCVKFLAGAEGLMGREKVEEILKTVETLDAMRNAKRKYAYSHLGSIADNTAGIMVEAIRQVQINDDDLASMIDKLEGRTKWCLVLALAKRGYEGVREELADMVGDYSVASNFRWLAFKEFCEGATQGDVNFLHEVARSDSLKIFEVDKNATGLKYVRVEELNGKVVDYEKRKGDKPLSVDREGGVYPFRVFAWHVLRRLRAQENKASQKDLDYVPLKVEFPRPMFVSWPNQFFPLLMEEIPNVKKYSGMVPKLHAPRDVENVSLGKQVTSSDTEPIIGDIAMVTDGDKTSSDGSYMEIGPGVQWVTIDLGERCEIFWIGVWHQHRMMNHVYWDVIVQISENEDFARYVTLFNNDHNGSSGFGKGADLLYPETIFGKWICADGLGGRYVRLYSNGSTMHELNQYNEVEVWGKPEKSDKEQKKCDNRLVPLPIELPKPVFQ